MKARLIVACVCVMLISAGGSWAGDVVEASRGRAPVAIAAVAVAGAAWNANPIKPWIHPTMPKPVSARLEAGFELAVERVREVESCRDLFAELGADALETLTNRPCTPVAALVSSDGTSREAASSR